MATDRIGVEVELRLPKRAAEELAPVDLEASYRDLLDECYSFKSVGGPFANMRPSRVLEEMGPIAFRCGMADMMDVEASNVEEIDGECYNIDEVQELRDTIRDEIEGETDC